MSEGPRHRQTWRGALLVVAALAGFGATVSGCGTHSTGSTKQATLSVAVVGRVIAGQSNGWILSEHGTRGNGTDTLYRYNADGAISPMAKFRNYAGPIATAFGGQVIVGGARCDDSSGCKGWVGELLRFDEKTGKQLSPVIVYREARPLEDSSSIAAIGVVDRRLLIGTPAGLVTMGTDGTVTPLAGEPPPGPGSLCVVDNAVYVALRPDLQRNGGGGFVVSPAGGQPQHVETQILVHTGNTWANVPSGSFATDVPAPGNAGCGYRDIEITSGTSPRFAWTPQQDWQPVPPIDPARTAWALGAEQTTSGGN